MYQKWLLLQFVHSPLENTVLMYPRNASYMHKQGQDVMIRTISEEAIAVSWLQAVRVTRSQSWIFSQQP